ncbi:phosphoenolpyruvate synthase [Mucilaginibacter terrigena]|uniref:Prodigiosin synthesizing transferase PigC n=1 Tax=Mucilaginibacter terrigena TaxID=2492395 RepID=A0A4Q5LLT8_9SPHI|nr:phosphoenolpyruvate synthase [Mucilaginibacter terrigena]RYU90537.1 phosphoenolpyruvate synthase [Mucilaginibacter terrigena]
MTPGNNKSNIYTLDLHNADGLTFMLVGGKGANLGELSKIKGISVPRGFCVTTEAYKKVTGDNGIFNGLLDELSRHKADARKNISEICANIRTAIESTPIAIDIVKEITTYITKFDKAEAFAVRSSATAEDLPAASFAGQQDTYLNVIGHDAILKHISKCWASLFTDRAVIYRIQNGFDHHKVQISVVVQQMVFSKVAGILFTADPISGNRKVLSIDASFGLGEALVSGLVNADNYKVREGKIIHKKISAKKLAIYPEINGGTKKQEIEAAQQNKQALTDAEILQLEAIGRSIETHFGSPQDIEWCLANGTFYIVQARPITTLYPIPQSNDQEKHVYLSVGHQQMMTDAMKPLGLSFWMLMTPPNTRTAGGRLFIDATLMLASPAGRDTILTTLGKFDPLFKDALTTIINRGDFIKPSPDEKKPGTGQSSNAVPLPDYHALNDYDPTIVSDLINSSQASLGALKQNILEKSGPDLFDFIMEDIGQLKKQTSDPRSIGVIMTGMNASTWINEKMLEWLGEKNAAGTTSQSAPNNITSEMGLDLLDVADVIRPYPEIIAYLEKINEDNFLEGLGKFKGGQETREAITNYLNKYGMRCVGEIDITNYRWAEKPIKLVSLILNNIKSFEPGAGKQRFEQGEQEALKKEQDLLKRLKQLPDGAQKAKETKRMIHLVRNYAGYREYPKYAIISRYFVYKQAILKEAGQLVKAGTIHEKEDIYYLNFEELKEAVRTRQVNYSVINKRKEEYKLYQKLSPPRVMTTDGETFSGSYNRGDLPANAIAGLAVSSGIVEGRARVILKMEDATLVDGDILVTTFTDPSWTPLFVSVKGLVTEVGGLMTHGAVIAREYGLPAVVGIDNVTKLIKDGQRIRVNGTDGYVEVL